MLHSLRHKAWYQGYGRHPQLFYVLSALVSSVWRRLRRVW